MTIEQQVPEYFDWLFSVWPMALVLFGVVVLLVFLCYLILSISRGPAEAFYGVTQALLAAGRDLIGLSPRRVIAIAKLAVQESIRRRVLLTVFIVMIVLLMFAAWFLDPHSDNPAKLYLSVILTVCNYMVLCMALLLSAFSLPNDIKHRTIYTVVTKPVRSAEIVIGRMLGFITIGTVLLVIMCVVSYIFVRRGLSHSHTEAVVAEVTDGAETAANDDGEKSLTDNNAAHRHGYLLHDDSEAVYTDRAKGHRHVVHRSEDGQVKFGPPVDMLRAKVPIYGTLRFLSREGKPSDRGISVGDEWQYRSYIEGQTSARAIWTFRKIRADQFPNGLPIELTIQVFRSYKGDIEKRIFGEIWLRHPTKPFVTKRQIFESQEFSTQQIVFPKEGLDRDLSVLTDAESAALAAKKKVKKKLNLFEDLVDDDGNIEVWMACAERAQYFGMAAPDCYLKAADSSFAWNFAKSYLSIWYQMVIVVAFGIMFSTFLNGPVSLLATLNVIIFGLFKKQIVAWGSGDVPGGGAIESAYRIVRQDNVMTELSMPKAGATAIKTLDYAHMQLVRGVTELVPSFGDFNTSDYVAHGFNIDPNLMWLNGTLVIVYFCVLAVLGLFFLKTRELAA